MTYEDKASYDSTPPCDERPVSVWRDGGIPKETYNQCETYACNKRPMYTQTATLNAHSEPILVQHTQNMYTQTATLNMYTGYTYVQNEKYVYGTGQNLF